MAVLNPRQWSEVERLFAEAIELPPDRRSEFLRRAHADPDVRREAISLLAHADQGLASVGQAIAAAKSTLTGDVDPDERLIGVRLGPYRVEAIVGHGGMGAVYRAFRDDAEFRQQVALKLVRAAAASPATLRRFRQERQILAHLAHPNIARLLDGGSTPEGVPYLVMEFIEGDPVTTWCERASPGIEGRLRLFLDVCAAVEFAHRGRVVHRDLKPANILVTRDGSPKLLDFGIAKLLDPDAQGEAVSLTSLRLMTPEYASPEQVRGEEISVATDIYALGLVLYEMLTGQKAQKIPNYTPDAINRVVCHLEPEAPAALKPQLTGDVDNIIRMAIRKEPERRYASVAEMAQDIQRHLAGHTVTARPDTIIYHAAKFLRRNRAAAIVGAAAAALLAVLVGMAFLAGGFSRGPRVSRVVPITQNGRVELGNSIASDGYRIYFTQRSGGQWSLAQVSVQGGTPEPIPLREALFDPEVMDISPDGSQLLIQAGFTTGEDRPLYLLSTQGGSAKSFGGVAGSSGAWSRDGRMIVFAQGAAIYLVNADGTGCRKLVDTPDRAYGIHWSRGAGPEVVRFALVHHGGRAGLLWEVRADGSNPHLLPLPGWKTNLVWPDTDDNGVWLASGKYYLFRVSRARRNSIWARRERHGLASLFASRPVQIYSAPSDLSYLVPSSDDKRIFFTAGQERRELARYDARVRQFVPFLPGVPGRAVSFSKDGRWVAYTTFLDDALWRSRPNGSERLRLTPPDMPASWPQWSPDGTKIIFTTGPPAKVFVVPAAGGPVESITPAAYLEAGTTWSPDGSSLLYWRKPEPEVSGTGRLYITRPATRETESLPGSDSLSRPTWSPDGHYIAANRGGKEILLWDLKRRQWTLLAKGFGVGDLNWSRDSQYVYFQDAMGNAEQPICRAHIGGRGVERVAGLSQVAQSDLAGFTLAGLDPTGAPIVSLIHTNSDLYALDIDWP